MGREALDKKKRAIIPVRVMSIIKETADAHGVTIPLMFGRRRTRQASRARFECWRRLREEVVIAGRPVSYPQIGAWFNKDHTSILYGVQWASTPEGREELSLIKFNYQQDMACSVEFSEELDGFCLKREPNGSILKRGTGAFAAPLPTVANT